MATVVSNPTLKSMTVEQDLSDDSIDNDPASPAVEPTEDDMKIAKLLLKNETNLYGEKNDKAGEEDANLPTHLLDDNEDEGDNVQNESNKNSTIGPNENVTGNMEEGSNDTGADADVDAKVDADANANANASANVDVDLLQIDGFNGSSESFPEFGIFLDSKEDDQSMSSVGNNNAFEEEDGDSYLSDEEDELKIRFSKSDIGHRPRHMRSRSHIETFENVVDGALLKSGIISSEPGARDFLDQTGAAVETLFRRITSLSLSGDGRVKGRSSNIRRSRLKKKSKAPGDLQQRKQHWNETSGKFQQRKPTNTEAERTYERKESFLRRFQKRMLDEEEEFTRKNSASTSDGNTVGIKNSFSTESEENKDNDSSSPLHVVLYDGIEDSSEENYVFDEYSDGDTGCGACLRPEDLAEFFPMANSTWINSKLSFEKRVTKTDKNETNGILESAIEKVQQKAAPVATVFHNRFIAPLSPQLEKDDVDATAGIYSEGVSNWLNRPSLSKDDEKTNHNEGAQMSTKLKDDIESKLIGLSKEHEEDDPVKTSPCAPFSVAKNVAMQKARTAKSYLNCGGEKGLIGCMKPDGQVDEKSKQKKLDASESPLSSNAIFQEEQRSKGVNPALLQAEAKNLAMSIDSVKAPIKKISSVVASTGNRALYKVQKFIAKRSPLAKGVCLQRNFDEENCELQEDTIIIHAEDGSRSFPFDESGSAGLSNTTFKIIGEIFPEDETNNTPIVKVSIENTESERSVKKLEFGEFEIFETTDDFEDEILPQPVIDSIEQAEILMSTSVYGPEFPCQVEEKEEEEEDCGVVECRTTTDLSMLTDPTRSWTVEQSKDHAVALGRQETESDFSVAAAPNTLSMHAPCVEVEVMDPSEEVEYSIPFDDPILEIAEEDNESTTIGKSIANSVHFEPKKAPKAKKPKMVRSFWKLSRRTKKDETEYTPSLPVSSVILMKDDDVEIAHTTTPVIQEIANEMALGKENKPLMKDRSQLLQRLSSRKMRKNDEQKIERTASHIQLSSSGHIHAVVAVGNNGCEVSL